MSFKWIVHFKAINNEDAVGWWGTTNNDGCMKTHERISYMSLKDSSFIISKQQYFHSLTISYETKSS